MPSIIFNGLVDGDIRRIVEPVPPHIGRLGEGIKWFAHRYGLKAEEIQDQYLILVDSTLAKSIDDASPIQTAAEIKIIPIIDGG